MAGSRSPSLAVRRIVSAMAWTCAELTGSGSEATALSNATFMIAIVSGGNDAFEKSFIWNRSWAEFTVLVVLAANARAVAETRAWVTPNGRAICFPIHRHRGEAAPQRAAV